MALRQRRTGGAGEWAPKVWWMRVCSWAKELADAASEEWLRVTVTSTIEPLAMSGGRSTEGNSIYQLCECESLERIWGFGRSFAPAAVVTYQPFVFCKEHGDSGVDLADC